MTAGRKKLLDDLEQQRKKYRGRKGGAVDGLYHYISVNREQMRYDVFRTKGKDMILARVMLKGHANMWSANA